MEARAEDALAFTKCVLLLSTIPWRFWSPAWVISGWLSAKKLCTRPMELGVPCKALTMTSGEVMGTPCKQTKGSTQTVGQVSTVHEIYLREKRIDYIAWFVCEVPPIFSSLTFHEAAPARTRAVRLTRTEGQALLKY